jgi:hydrogenase nickel incorporation protein HypA/HybF
MHEISIMQSALELAEAHAREVGATAISRISLRVGIVSGVVPEAMRFAFDVLKTNTMAASASLEIEQIPGVFRCSSCGGLVSLQTLRFDCPSCHGLLTMDGGGADLELAQLEIS